MLVKNLYFRSICQINLIEHQLIEKVLYWHLWFHEEPLTFVEPFHCTKGPYSEKMIRCNLQ